MFFNLNEALERGVNEGTNYSSHAISPMEFEKPHIEGDDRYED
jgi:hypothetical protein